MTERCPDCDAAKSHAYSDATTPGFFRLYCPKHDPQNSLPGMERAKEPQQMTLEGTYGHLDIG